jgi:hypothetical protein
MDADRAMMGTGEHRKTSYKRMVLMKPRSRNHAELEIISVETTPNLSRMDPPSPVAGSTGGEEDHEHRELSQSRSSAARARDCE